MVESLRCNALVHALHDRLDQLPDLRRGKNTQYAMKDAALAAFAVFFTQSPSFLAHQQTLCHAKGGSNAERLFSITRIPCDNQIRTLLDPIPPQHLCPLVLAIIQALTTAGVIDTFRAMNDMLLIALDGTQYFSSQCISCANCAQKTAATGTITSSQCLLMSMLVAPGKTEVLALEPEFITSQDGHIKQECVQRLPNAGSAATPSCPSSTLPCWAMICSVIPIRALSYTSVVRVALMRGVVLWAGLRMLRPTSHARPSKPGWSLLPTQPNAVAGPLSIMPLSSHASRAALPCIGGVSVATVRVVISPYNRLGPAALDIPGKGGRRNAYLSLGLELAVESSNTGGLWEKVTARDRARPSASQSAVKLAAAMSTPTKQRSSGREGAETIAHPPTPQRMRLSARASSRCS